MYYDDVFFVSYYDDLSSSLCEFISLPTFHMFMTGIHMTPKTYLYSQSVPRRWFSHNMHWNMIFPVIRMDGISRLSMENQTWSSAKSTLKHDKENIFSL